MITVLLLIACIVCIGLMALSIYHLLLTKSREYQMFSVRHFVVLVIVYIILIIGFSFLYLGLDLAGYPSVKFEEMAIANGTIQYLSNLIYFSTMTILTIGYGDIVPLGLARFLASIQALIGFLLPAAFLITGLNKFNDNEKGNKQ